MFQLQRYHVNAGTFFVSRRKPMILEAYLATCVGVALYDADSGVGGLAHLLLPEPISVDSIADPAKYATTGMPLFLEALLEAGADPERLKACVAGGALVRPLAEMDLSLNTGGRTESAVREFLDKRKIPIERAETSGYLTCRLSLDTQRWETSIDPTLEERPASEAAITPPTTRDIQAAIDSLQPIPQIALQILDTLEDENYDVQTIADQVRQEQVIAAKTLQLCNSSFYHRGRKIETVDHAIIMLGRELFVKLVISSIIEDFFSRYIQGYSLCKGGLFSHSLGTAITAERIARQTGVAAPAVAYSAGLLHDIGKVVLDQFVADVYPLFYRRLQDENTDSLMVEQEVFGTDHARVGFQLARKWAFPQSLTEAIGLHHRIETETDISSLLLLVHLANHLMTSFHAGFKLGGQHATRVAWCLGKLGIPLADYPKIVDLVPVQFADF
jgi:putative nucleotidyltransferase with HDIG domain